MQRHFRSVESALCSTMMAMLRKGYGTGFVFQKLTVEIPKLSFVKFHLYKVRNCCQRNLINFVLAEVAHFDDNN